jgi:signal transduction histidine kinase
MGGYEARGISAQLACDEIQLPNRAGLPGRSPGRRATAEPGRDRGRPPGPAPELKLSVLGWLGAGVVMLALLAGVIWWVSGQLAERSQSASAGAALAAPAVRSADVLDVAASERAGPAGDMVRWSGVWARHGGEIVAIAVLVMGQSAAIAGLLFERRRRRRAECEARQRLADVADLDRVASAGALSASIAHELNQPLGAILSNAEAAEIALRSAAPDFDLCTESLGDIRRDVRRAADILAHLRGLLRRAPLTADVVDVNDAARGVLKVIAAEAKERHVTLGACLFEAALPVRADLVHLQQAVLNAALNGFDAMDELPHRRRHLSLRTAPAGKSEVWVSIADRGTGIPPDALNRIFDRLYTTKSSGTGLGLSIARMIVETYGGRMWAENRPAGGAVIRFSLPLAPRLGAAGTKIAEMPPRTTARATMS